MEEAASPIQVRMDIVRISPGVFQPIAATTLLLSLPM
jgi:hypothetical protein